MVVAALIVAIVSVLAAIGDRDKPWEVRQRRLAADPGWLPAGLMEVDFTAAESLSA